MKPRHEPVFDAAGRPIRDALGRAFDAVRFHPRLDKLKRFVNARAGRVGGKAKRPAPAQSTFPAMDTATTPAPTDSATPAEGAPTPETIPPAADATPPPAGPDFSDIETAAGPAASVERLAAQLEAATAEGSTPTAETIIGIIQTVLCLIGEEEGILTEAEKLIIRPPLVAILKKYNVGADVLPVEVSLIVALAGVVVTRLKKPKTAKFAAKVRAWIVDLWFSRKGREIQRVVAREAANS